MLLDGHRALLTNTACNGLDGACRSLNLMSQPEQRASFALRGAWAEAPLRGVAKESDRHVATILSATLRSLPSGE